MGLGAGRASFELITIRRLRNPALVQPVGNSKSPLSASCRVRSSSLLQKGVALWMIFFCQQSMDKTDSFHCFTVEYRQDLNTGIPCESAKDWLGEDLIL